MRILTVGNMYPPHHLGGYELTWRSAVAHLRALDHEVRVLTTDHREPTLAGEFSDQPDVYRDLRWYWRDHEFPRRSPRARIALERHNGRVLERHLQELRPDAVNWWAMGGMSLSLIERARRARVPSVGVVGDDWMLYAADVDGWTRMLRRLGRAGPLAGAAVGVPAGLDLTPTRWVFISETVRRGSLESAFDLPLTEVAHPGIDPELFHPAAASEWGWRLLYVGRIDERKGIDTAIRALALLPPEATLTVDGRGDERELERLCELRDEHGLGERVRFTRSLRSELRHVYARGDVLVFGVRWEEPWGLVPLEAMAVGTPVVATGAGGSGEYLRHDHNALVVGRDAGPERVAAAVRALASDPALRERLREGGLRTAAEYPERRFNDAVAAALERAVAR